MKYIHHVPESCLRHCIQGVSEVEVDSIDSLGFMYDEVHFLYVDVYTSTLPVSTLPRF